MKQIDILGIKIDNISIGEAVKRSIAAMDANRQDYVLVLDSQELLLAKKSRKLMEMTRKALLVLPGDNGVDIAASILGLPLTNKMSAIDYSTALLARLGELSGRVYLLGGHRGLVQRAASDLAARFPGLEIVGAEDINGTEEADLIRRINAQQPDLLILSMDFYRQMQLIAALSGHVDIGLFLGIGNAMDDYGSKRREASPLKRLLSQPEQTMKKPRIVLAALKYRILG